MIIIPIGVDCGNASLFKENNLRNFSLPFDWSVTYNGVSKIIKNDFNDYIPKDNNSLNIIDDVYFVHNEFPKDNEQMLRRINRLKSILETSNEKVVFIRKGHACHNHNEHDGRYNIIKSDIQDAEELNIVLQEKYPNLNYEIIVFLICGKCFIPPNNSTGTERQMNSSGDLSSELYNSVSKNIKIYNISCLGVNDILFSNICLEYLSKMTPKI